MFNIAIFSGYVVANVALFWRAFRPSLRWWQGILVWVGGLLAGISFTPFVGPPTFEEQAIGSEKMLPAKLGLFVMSLALGLVLIWVGTWRRKGSKTSGANK